MVNKKHENAKLQKPFTWNNFSSRMKSDEPVQSSRKSVFILLAATKLIWKIESKNFGKIEKSAIFRS